MRRINKICIVGFGEVGRILAEDLGKSGISNLTVWDVLFADPASSPSRALPSSSAAPGASAHEAMAGADAIISAVTAAETVAAATQASRALAPGAWYLDLNSASPGAKLAAARLIEKSGARYVEAAVMAPISPKRLGTSILTGGPHAKEFSPIAAELGFTGLRFFSEDTGKASAAKMCRSVMVKGVEALLIESLVTARHYGVEETVIGSLSDLFPGPDWNALSHYMISRSLEHGGRRAEEMQEAARAVLEARIEPLMSVACAERQKWAGVRKSAMSERTLPAMLDALLETVDREEDAASC